MYSGWDMCSLSMDLVSHGYLSMMSHMDKISYVLPIDGSNISQLYTRDLPYIRDEPCVQQLFTQDELCAQYWWFLYLVLISQDELCAPYGCVYEIYTMCSTIIYPWWAMCSISTCPISRGYFPRWAMCSISMCRVSNTSWLFTQRFSCVLHMEESSTPPEFTLVIHMRFAGAHRFRFAYYHLLWSDSRNPLNGMRQILWGDWMPLHYVKFFFIIRWFSWDVLIWIIMIYFDVKDFLKECGCHGRLFWLPRQ